MHFSIGLHSAPSRVQSANGCCLQILGVPAMRSLLAILTTVVLLGQAFAATDRDREAIRDMVQKQIEAFKSDDAMRAFSFAAPALQSMFGSPERFMAMVRDSYQPVYRPRSYTMGQFKEGPEGSSLSVSIQDAEGIDWTAIYTLEQQSDGSWRISGCYLARAQGQSV